MDSAAVSSSFGFSNQLHASRSDSVFRRRRKGEHHWSRTRRGWWGGGGGRKGTGIPSDWLEVGKPEWKATNNGTASLLCYFHANHVLVEQILTHLSRNSLSFSSKAGCQYRRTNVRVISAWLNDQELTWWSKIIQNNNIPKLFTITGHITICETGLDPN